MSNTPACRSCGSRLGLTLIDLGQMPLANALLASAEECARERVYPLHARVCEECFLVQVDDVVPPDEIFTDYVYFSSYSESWVEHAKTYARQAVARLGLDKSSFVVEVASNDGYLLQHFRAEGIPVLGIEPAANVAARADILGIRTETLFFGRQTSMDLAGRYGRADLLVGNNVLAHVPNINDFVAGFANMLKPSGVATFEFPHLQNLIEQVQFDTIYHEHFSYLSLLATERLFARHALRVFDVEQLTTHGGSLRLWVCHEDADFQSRPALAATRADEQAAKLAKRSTYEDFGTAVNKIRVSLRRFIDEVHASGKTLAAYGAAAKGNTLLSSCNVTSADISFVADLNEHKQGRLLPGSHIPVRPPEAIFEAQPDYVLILPWNLRDEITSALAGIRDWGGRFVIPVPKVNVLP